MIAARERGEEYDFPGFMQRHGDLFPEHPKTLDELLEVLAKRMAAMSRLLASPRPSNGASSRELAQALLSDMDLASRWTSSPASSNALAPNLPWDMPVGGGMATSRCRCRRRWGRSRPSATSTSWSRRWAAATWAPASMTSTRRSCAMPWATVRCRISGGCARSEGAGGVRHRHPPERASWRCRPAAPGGSGSGHWWRSSSGSTPSRPASTRRGRPAERPSRPAPPGRGGSATPARSPCSAASSTPCSGRRPRGPVRRPRRHPAGRLRVGGGRAAHRDGDGPAAGPLLLDAAARPLGAR